MKPEKEMWGSLRFHQRIRNILLLYYLTPIVLILVASGGFYYHWTKRSLSQEMGHRLISIARSAASAVRGFHISALQLKDASNLTYSNLRQRFERIREANQVSKIYIFTHEHESLLDTDPDQEPGNIYERHQLNRAELEQVRQGQPAASLLFRGEDGLFFKSAFAPVMDKGEVVAMVGVDGSATFFASLHELGRRMVFFALACVMVVILVSIVISKMIVNPIELLVAEAKRIGEGQLHQKISVESGTELGFLGYVLDEMRKSIVSRDRELQVMLRGIAHEVRNPLGGMELFAGLLEEEVKEEKARESVSRIQREIKTLKTLVEEFLDFARGPSLQLRPVKIRPFLEELPLAFQKEFGNQSIEMKMNLNGLEEVEFDFDQMRRACLNIIQNSVHALPHGGEIVIEVRENKKQVEWTFADNGVGIQEEDLDRLFDPFFTTKEAGTGLGLSFVRKIVNAHGGEVFVQSTIGEGTKIILALPK